ncbi:PD-(D/E)XK nuclease family protein [Bacteroides sp. 224]|uniref:PD-(D/E)XK nuclease family protein n=1 Tax=Bacteroides sp. 224 TaxID=2302936 RepID=UPI0013D69671|nr:PD-(D/E)XK nuclease family protein [Bacteroides sp. 224]NDV64338.1 PD-(D/E)XK nuclease family protein [Bacteroides sp. 224]
METFLQLVAKNLYSKVGNDLSRVAVVFPNKRAGLFFNEYLANESDIPIWSPAYLNISELLQSLSKLHLGDSIRLICELHKAFLKETEREEPLDEFYFWGELLLADFDDIDKNLVQADRLFTNLKDLKQIMEGYDFLNEEQEEAIQQFFQNFSIEKHTELKERFISLWDKLGAIYNTYKKRLEELGIAYEGMLYRDGINNLSLSSLPYDKYVFVGFNVLNKVETKLFQELKDAERALFYWDYDVFYTEMKETKHEAGIYINRNLKEFPSELSEESFDNLRKPKKVQFISASTENAQTRYLPEWIRTNLSGKEKENAVVLCNESLLLPTLHSIPDSVKNVNVTMGFPLAQTPAYTFVDAILELQTNGYDPKTGRYTYEAVQKVLKHPYTQRLSPHADALEREITVTNRFYPLPSELKRDPFLTMIFSPCATLGDLCYYTTVLLKETAVIYREESEYKDVFSQLYRESLFKCYTICNRMLNLVSSGELVVRTDTFKRLIHRLLSATNIPFHGEPAIGMQVMGVLETRNLDFKNIIVMSLNEGLLPKTGGSSSFIPYSLRKAFGMTTVEHQDALYAYYFYRLIQRAENITLLYNTSSDGLNKGEESRFLKQFLIEWPHEITRKFLEAGQSPQSTHNIEVLKSEEIIELLHTLYDAKKTTRILSPSALNAYLNCTLRFYYKYVARLKEPNEVNTEIDSSTFGIIFHDAVERIYKKLTEKNKQIIKEDLEKIAKSEVTIQEFVDLSFKKHFFKIPPEEKSEYNGTQLINSKVIATYIKQLLRIDAQYAPFQMVAMEKNVQETLYIKTTKGITEVNIGGTIDRLDSKEATLRIVDYKTGGNPKTPANIEQLFTPSEDRPSYIFQTFLYAAIMTQKQSLKVAPSLLYIHRAASEDYSPIIEMGEARKEKYPVDNFAFYEDEFRERLQNLLEEIFNPEIPFVQTDNKKFCEYCDYKSICKR